MSSRGLKKNGGKGMAFRRGYEPHRKKKSKGPWIWVLLISLVLGYSYYKRKQIILLFARDQSVRAEKAKDKAVELWKNANLSDQAIEDFQSSALLFSEKEPNEPQAFYLYAHSIFWNLHKMGIHFDSQSLILTLGSEFEEFLGKSQQASTSLDNIFWNSRKAESLTSSTFSDWENNKLLLFLGETHRTVKRPEALLKEYGKLEVDKLSPEFINVFYWLLAYNTMQAGDAEGLEKFLDLTKQEKYESGIKFSSREETYLKGIAKYYKKDFVNALSLLRQARTESPDKITSTTILLEASIFHKQNLSQKAIDLLEDFYFKTGKKNEEAYLLIQKIISEKQGLKTKVERRSEPTN